jgi:hypothetical protein
MILLGTSKFQCKLRRAGSILVNNATYTSDEGIARMNYALVTAESLDRRKGYDA